MNCPQKLLLIKDSSLGGFVKKSADRRSLIKKGKHPSLTSSPRPSMFHLACIRKYTRPRPPPRKLYPRPFARSSLFLSPEEQRQRLASAKLHRLLLDSRPLSSFPPYKTSLAGFFLAALRAASTLDNKATAAVRKGKLGIRPRNYPSNFFNAKSSALFARYAFSRI